MAHCASLLLLVRDAKRVLLGRFGLAPASQDRLWIEVNTIKKQIHIINWKFFSRLFSSMAWLLLFKK